MEALLQSESAKRLHVSNARVSQMIQKGMPVPAEGKVDVAEALNRIESNIDLASGREWVADSGMSRDESFTCVRHGRGQRRAHSGGQ